MKLFSWGKDGGPKSTVFGFWLTEIKSLVSVVALRFDDGSRDEYHSHAFNSVSWVLSGKLREEHLSGSTEYHRPSLLPVITKRDTFHRVFSEGTTWVISFRGPWAERWKEFDPKTHQYTVLGHGRVVDGGQAR